MNSFLKEEGTNSLDKDILITEQQFKKFEDIFVKARNDFQNFITLDRNTCNSNEEEKLPLNSLEEFFKNNLNDEEDFFSFFLRLKNGYNLLKNKIKDNNKPSDEQVTKNINADEIKISSRNNSFINKDKINLIPNTDRNFQEFEKEKILERITKHKSSKRGVSSNNDRGHPPTNNNNSSVNYRTQDRLASVSITISKSPTFRHATPDKINKTGSGISPYNSNPTNNLCNTQTRSKKNSKSLIRMELNTSSNNSTSYSHNMNNVNNLKVFPNKNNSKCLLSTVKYCQGEISGKKGDNKQIEINSSDLYVNINSNNENKDNSLQILPKLTSEFNSNSAGKAKAFTTSQNILIETQIVNNIRENNLKKFLLKKNKLY